MAIHFHESEVAAEPVAVGVKTQPLINAARFPDMRVKVERITIEAGAALPLAVATDSLAWLQIIDGSAKLSGTGVCAALASEHVTFLPQEFQGRLEARDNAVVIMTEVPNVSRLDRQFAKSPPPLKVVDWQREPVLASEHDARRRIYLATPKLFGTHAVKGEMIIYPPGTCGANHHHVGADHFMVFLKGRGTAYADETPFRVRQGDVVYYHDLERHYLMADDDSEMVFVEFFVPGDFRTVWVDEALVCTWNPTGRDIAGGIPVRDIARHSVAGGTPQDV